MLFVSEEEANLQHSKHFRLQITKKISCSLKVSKNILNRQTILQEAGCLLSIIFVGLFFGQIT